VVRFIVDDDRAQARRARSPITASMVLLPTTVVLEAEWVSRSAYKFAPSEIHRALNAFCGLTNVTLAEPAIVATALQLFGRGLDLADAMHIATPASAGQTSTFDRSLRKLVTRLRGPVAVVEP
jgi:predicted nucleic-acid-binding protein